MVTLLSRYVNNLRKDRRAQRSAARQTLPPPQRASGIPKRSLMICTPPEARGSILRECNHLWRARTPQRHRENKGSICRYNMRDFLLKASPLRARERGPQPSAWKGNSANFALKLSENPHERAKRLTIKRLIAA